MLPSSWRTLACMVFISLGICKACLITNCPKGGKRTVSNNQDSEGIRQCARCGPAKLGHCYGPAICCGPQIGCLIATPDSVRCFNEATSPIPCRAPTGGPCGEDSSGLCTANGICCNHESCHIDANCRLTINDSNELIEPNDQQANPLYSLYYAIRNSYQQDYPISLSASTGERK